MEEEKQPPKYIDVNIKMLLSQAMVDDMGAYTNTQLEHIATLITMFTHSGSYAFFTAQQIAVIKNAMENHEYFRRFILNLYETTNVLRASFVKPGEDVSWEKEFVLAIKRSRTQYEDAKKSLLLDSVCEWAKFSSSSELDSIIDNNMWLVTLYLACFTGAAEAAFHDYNDYSGFMQKPASDSN